MKLLLNANISWRVKKHLLSFCEEILHVDSSGLQVSAKDTTIWDFAKQNNFIIVTQDEDFWHLLLQRRFPPKVVLLRTGNQSTPNIVDSLKKYQNDIQELSAKNHLGILEIF